MKKISAFRSFLMISAVFFPSVDSESGTWFEAQRECAIQNKMLPTDFPSSQAKGNPNTYWTRYSQRKSNWTQLLGCYPDSKVSGTAKAESMSIPSVGMCQEICASYSTFAVKCTTCRCLRSFSSADQDRLSIDHCNKSCGNITSQPFTRQCGGENAYNVYRSNSMDFKFKGEGMCLSIQCAEHSKFYKGDSCATVLYAACEKARAQDKWADWTSSMKFCETHLSSYLLGGDLLLTNITSDCRNVQNVSNHSNTQNWIAVARQIYFSIDQGYPIMNESDFTDCRQCSKNHCSYVPCSNQIKFICSDKVDSSTSTHSVFSKTELFSSPQTLTSSVDTEITEFKTNVPTTSDKSRYHSTSSSVEITTPVSGSADKNVSAFTTTSDAVIFTHHSSSVGISTPVSGSVDKNVSDQKEIVAAIVTPIVVLFGAVIVFGVVYFRRCKGNATSETARSKKMEAKHLESNQYTYVDSSNNNYFVLEPGSHISELDDTTKAESESPYNDLPEGEYDLLRDKDSRRKVSDDTYATSAKPSDYSDYDVTNRNRQTEEDNTYDHAGSNITSLYGYGSVQHQEQDENAYSTSEY